MVAHSLESDQCGKLYFEAFVEYHSPARNSSKITNVKIIRNGHQDGIISLVESGDLVIAFQKKMGSCQCLEGHPKWVVNTMSLYLQYNRIINRSTGLWHCRT